MPSDRRPTPRRRRDRPALLAVLLVLGLALSACATIPTSGPVRQGQDLGQGVGERGLRSVGQPPAKGADPEAIVRGFLQSGADFRDDHSFARAYLAADVRGKWDPGTGATVYDKATASFEPQPDGSVLMTASEIARVGEDGRYQRAAADVSVERRFQLTRERGEWRISSTDDGLLLTTSDLEIVYRHFNLYFLAPTTNTVVPDPVLLPAVLPGLATKLVTRLLRGPTDALRGAVDSAFPPGTQLDVASVPVRGGVATVRLNAAALEADGDARSQMSAQMVYTLRQLPEIRSVRILAGGNDLVTSGAPREQPVTAWGTYDPDILGSSASLYVVREGRIGQLIDGRFAPVQGEAGVARGPQQSALRSPAVSIDARRVAVAANNRTAILVGRLAQGAPLNPVLSDPRAEFSAGSWDNNSDLWFIDRAANRLWLLLREQDQPVPVSVPAVPAGGLSVVRVSREGTRIALVAGTGAGARLYVGAIARSPTGSVQAIDGLHEVLPDLTGVRDVAWLDADTLVALGARGDQPELPMLTSTDGFEVDAGILPLRDLGTVAAAPAGSKLPIVAGSNSGQLYMWDVSFTWQPLGAGRDPAYPG